MKYIKSRVERLTGGNFTAGFFLRFLYLPPLFIFVDSWFFEKSRTEKTSDSLC
jgi:hypothetical protein